MSSVSHEPIVEHPFDMGLVSGVCPQEVLAISVGRSSVTEVCRPGELLSGTEEQVPGMYYDQRGRGCHRAEVCPRKVRQQHSVSNDWLLT